MFGAWSYSTKKMNLTTESSAIIMDGYKENGEWEITNTKVSWAEFFFDCCPDEKFAKVTFSVYLRRKYSYYIMNVIVPSLLTSVVLLSLFFCVPAQKMHIGIATLLSFRMFLMAISSSIPKTDSVPFIGELFRLY